MLRLFVLHRGRREEGDAKEKGGMNGSLLFVGNTEVVEVCCLYAEARIVEDKCCTTSLL
jgi:hypothetical protein